MTSQCAGWDKNEAKCEMGTVTLKVRMLTRSKTRTRGDENGDRTTHKCRRCRAGQSVRGEVRTG